MKYNNSSGADGVTNSLQKYTKLGLLEKHYDTCKCSYCMERSFRRWSMGRVAPGSKAWNSWWYLYWRYHNANYYLRYHSIFYKWKKP